MSSVVLSALKMTLGLYLNKVRTSWSESLKDGDLNSQQFRSLIMSDMESIKTQIDGLARRELLSSASFIQEGMFLLNELLDTSHKRYRYKTMSMGRDRPIRQPPFAAVFRHIVHFKNWLNR